VIDSLTVYRTQLDEEIRSHRWLSEWCILSDGMKEQVGERYGLRNQARRHKRLQFIAKMQKLEIQFSFSANEMS